uniref:Uncharacterized protein n=1 Tax=Meleagris gallopavo TaxID=9103 RepID=A0A803XZQ4_MELGA
PGLVAVHCQGAEKLTTREITFGNLEQSGSGSTSVTSRPLRFFTYIFGKGDKGTFPHPVLPSSLHSAGKTRSSGQA